MRVLLSWVPRWLLALPLGCAGAVSLDDPEGSSGAPMSGAGPFGADPTRDAEGGDQGGSEGSLDGDAPKLDVAPDLPLPPGSCDPDCQVELTTAWTYDGFAGPLGLDPDDRVQVIVDPEGGVMVAEQRQGAITLARLDAYGQELWTLPLALPCAPCRLVELGLHPSGDLLLAGHGLDLGGSPVALAARIELGGPNVEWITSTALVEGRGIVPRAGSLVVRDEARLFQPVLEGSVRDGLEWLDLLAYDAASGERVSTSPLANGLASGDAPEPRAARDSTGWLVVSHPAWPGVASLTGMVLWLDADGTQVVATGTRSEPSRRLVTDSAGRTLTLGQPPGPTSSALFLDSGRVQQPEEWSLLLALSTTGHPALAVDGYGHAHILARFEPRVPDQVVDPAVQVMRWSEVGDLVWTLVLSLALDDVADPVSLSLTPAGDLVIGGFVAGVRHVEMLRPGCRCG